MNRQIRQKTIVTTAVLAAFGVGAAAVHFGCAQQGGGGAPNPFADNLAKMGGEIGSSVTGRSEIAQGVNAGLNWKNSLMLSADDEDAMGQSVALNLTSSYRLTSNEALNKYVSMVGLSIAEASPRPTGNWLFGVLESSEVNAFAGPNGYIFVTTGALKQMRDESELAGVLAHELTHVLHHHGLAGVKNDANADALKAAATIAVNSNGADRYGVFNKVADPVVEGVAKKGYARNQELDADSNAVQLLVAAGYDPRGLVRFLERLQSSGGDLMSTHPGKQERIAKANAQIKSLGNPQGKTLEDRFRKSAAVR